jgi:hypothetical protein
MSVENKVTLKLKPETSFLPICRIEITVFDILHIKFQNSLMTSPACNFGSYIRAVDPQRTQSKFVYIKGSRGITPSFLTSALDGGEWSALRLRCFSPGEISPYTRWIGG